MSDDYVRARRAWLDDDWNVAAKAERKRIRAAQAEVIAEMHSLAEHLRSGHGLRALGGELDGHADRLEEATSDD